MAILEEYHAPESIQEAVNLLARRDRRLVPMAGGTSLVGQLETRAVADIDGVVDLRNLALDSTDVRDKTLAIGAMVTLTALCEHDAAATLANGILAVAARGEGPINLRNVATVGGIVAAAACDSEFYTALLALGATVVTSDGAVEQSTPLHSYRATGELIVSVQLSLVQASGGSARVAWTPADRPIVAAICVCKDGLARVALCGVAERPQLAGALLDPPDDFKGSAEYRRAMADIVVARARAAADKAEPKPPRPRQ